MSSETADPDAVHPARIEAMSRKLEDLREELEEERAHRESLQERVDELEETLEVVGVDSLTPDTPDKRALAIRQWLWKEANANGGTARMDKDVARGVLGGLARTQLYEAMRRAADGDEGARQGSSDLSPVQGFEFQSFEDPERKNRVIIDVEDVQQAQFGTDYIETGGDSA